MSDREQFDWLLEQTASARESVELWDKLQTLEKASDEFETLEGLLLAVLHQVQVDAKDVQDEHERIMDALPDDDDECPRLGFGSSGG